MNMCCPQRYFVVILGFWGLLISIGYRAVVALVMVHVIKSSEPDELKESFFGNCTATGDGTDLSLNWTVATSQYLNTAYFVGSVITQLPGGYLASRYSPHRVCGISILISSILLLCIPVSMKYNKILVFSIRFIQGVVEGCSVPALNGVISAWAPKYEKSKMVTFVYSGAYLSPAVAQIVTGFTACWLAWFASLYIYGGLGVIWSIIWLCCIYATPDKNPYLKETERKLFQREGSSVKQGSALVASHIPWRRILTSLPMSAIIVGSFCRNWIFAMVITEVPQYFKDVYHSNIATISLKVALPEVLMTVVTITGGIMVDRFIKSSVVSTTIGRKLAQCIGFGIEAVCFLAMRWVDNSHTALIVLSVGVALSGLAISGYQVNPLDLAPQYASVLTGLSRLGAVGAILSTSVAGRLREENLKSWQNIFTIAGSIHIAGVVYYGIFASGRRQDWADVAETKSLIRSARNQSPTSNDNETDEEPDFKYSASQRYDRIETYDAPDWFTVSYP